MCKINMILDVETLLRLDVAPDVVAGFLAIRSSVEEIATARQENLGRSATPVQLRTRQIIDQVLAEAERQAAHLDSLDG